MIPWINLTRQYHSIQKEIITGIDEVLNSKQYILGNNVKKFEEKFSEFHNTKFSVGVNSGTDALQLALIAIGIKEGDEVITVPNTAVPTICAISGDCFSDLGDIRCLLQRRG